MKSKKIPMRTCIVSHEKCAKQDLFRIVRTPENNIIIDDKGKQNGHGAYLKKNLEVIKKARQSKILEKYLEITIPEEIYDELLEKL